ncbi:MAG TPA: hypothetical protein VF680_14810 [Allosphingosinicella sp.]|jgi:hypothetical protein
MHERDSASMQPFLVRVAPGLNPADYEAAERVDALMSSSYDPITQTSITGISAGSAKTYDPSFSGMWARKDDSTVSDW